MGLFEARTETGGGGKATRELDHVDHRLGGIDVARFERTAENGAASAQLLRT